MFSVVDTEVVVSTGAVMVSKPSAGGVESVGMLITCKILTGG